MFEALVSVAVMGLIVISLGEVTGQWLPNWHRGFGRLQRVAALDAGLRRIVADIAGAEFVTANGQSRTALFFGDASSILFVRASVEPNTPPHLAFVRLAPARGPLGLEWRRQETPYAPFAADTPPAQVASLAAGVSLIRSPYRVSFAYAGPDRVWRAEWRDAPTLPSAVRIDVFDVETGRLLPLSTVASPRVDAPVDCVGQISAVKCLANLASPPLAKAAR